MRAKPAFHLEKGVRIGAQVYDYLRREILEMRLLPRTRLSEADIAVSLGVSRTPAREALIKLSEEGLVHVYPQSGTMVAPIRVADVLAAQFARESLECAAVRLAAEKVTPKDAVTLRGIIARQDKCRKAGDSERFFKADEELHQALMTIAGHPAAWELVASAKAQLDRVRHVALRAPLKLDAVMAEHRAIVDAVIAKEADRAVSCLRAHVREIFSTAERLFTDNPSLFEEYALPEDVAASKMTRLRRGSGPAGDKRTFDRSSRTVATGEGD